MAYSREDEPPETSGIFGRWLAFGMAEFVVIRFGARYTRQVPAHGLVTFAEAATLIRKNGRPVSRQTVYNLAAAGKLRFVNARLYPGSNKSVQVVKLSELRKFVERHGFDPVPLG